MSKKTKIIILVIVVLLLSGGAAYYFKQKGAKEKAENEKEREQPKEPINTGSMSGIMLDVEHSKADKSTAKKQMEVAGGSKQGKSLAK